MKVKRSVLVGLVMVAAAFGVLGQLHLAPPEMSFWIDAEEGWWTDVIVLADGSGPSAFLRELEPDALNWCHWELPTFLHELGTRRVGSTHLGFQESLERVEGDLEGWEWTPSLAYNVYDEPVYYGDWGGSYFMDPHATEWADAVLQGIRDSLAKGDGVSQDNIGVPPFIKGQCGFSPTEKEEFRDFLAASMSTRTLETLAVDPDRLDIADYIRTRGYTDGSPLAETDPIFRAFVAYQYISNLGIWQGMLDEVGIHSIPDKIIHGNQYGVWSPWDSNPYSLLLSQLHQVVEIEYVSHLQAVPPDVRDSLQYKLGLASGRQEKPVWFRGIVYDWQTGASILRANHLRLLAASTYANGAVRTFEYGQGTPTGYFEIPPDAEDSLLQYYDWLNDIRFLFEQRRSAANVAIVYSMPTMMWRYFPATGHWNSAQIGSLSGFADVLEREHIPYDTVIFGHPSVWDDAGLESRLGPYDVVILPAVDCLSLKQIEVLSQFVDRGGRILFTGDLGQYDEDLEARPSSDLAGLFASSHVFGLNGAPARTYFQQDVMQRNASSTRSEKAALTAAVRSALDTDALLAADAPETVAMNVFETRDGGYSVHLLNLDYDAETDTLSPAGSFTLRVRVPGTSPSDVPVWLFHDDGSTETLSPQASDGWIELLIPTVKCHTIVHFGHLTAPAEEAIDAAKQAQALNRWAQGDPEIDALFEQAEAAFDDGDMLSVLSLCADLESLIASANANVLYDFSHAQQAALDWESALAISEEHPEWFLLEGLADHVTAQADSGPIDAAALLGVHALVIAPHRMPFGASEIDAIREHVSSGAGLLLIGNGGSPSEMRALTKPFGLEFLPYACLGAEDHLWDFVSFNASSIVEHPVTTGVDALQLNYAAAMILDERWTPLILTGDDTWQETGEDEAPSPGELLGPFPAVAIRTLGAGRIAAVCDDGPFAEWGAPSLLHNLIVWLTGG